MYYASRRRQLQVKPYGTLVEILTQILSSHYKLKLLGSKLDLCCIKIQRLTWRLSAFIPPIPRKGFKLILYNNNELRIVNSSSIPRLAKPIKMIRNIPFEIIRYFVFTKRNLALASS
ncbi:MAG: hypothetical protein ACKESC_01295, partial [Candidatus Hodgkinia cicadicola]